MAFIPGSRGFFSEGSRADLLSANGIEGPFVKDNHVLSARRGMVRGLLSVLARVPLRRLTDGPAGQAAAIAGQQIRGAEPAQAHGRASRLTVSPIRCSLSPRLRRPANGEENES
jgi:hypothetical protein